MKYKVKSEEEWHKLRAKCITASEAAVLVGLNPYSSPGKLKNSTFTGNSFTLVGQVLEPVVVDVTNRVMKREFKLFEDAGEGKVFYVKGNLGATPDATDGTELLECKTTRPQTFLKYFIAAPNNYLIQLQVQLHCTGKKVGYLAIMSTDLTQQCQEIKWPMVIYKVVRSDIIMAILQEEAERFFKIRDAAPEENLPAFRTKSPYKKKVELLLQLSTTKIHS